MIKTHILTTSKDELAEMDEVVQIDLLSEDVAELGFGVDSVDRNELVHHVGAEMMPRGINVTRAGPILGNTRLFGRAGIILKEPGASGKQLCIWLF
jgi:hypothetical protein